MVVLNSPFPLAAGKHFWKLLSTGCGNATVFALIAEDASFWWMLMQGLSAQLLFSVEMIWLEWITTEQMLVMLKCYPSLPYLSVWNEKFKVIFFSPFLKFRIIPLPQKLKFTCQQPSEQTIMVNQQNGNFGQGAVNSSLIRSVLT